MNFHPPKLIWLCILFLGILVLLSLIAPWISPDPFAQNVQDALEKPSFAHWMGTDSLGRDLWARVLYGARISLFIGIASTLVASILGTALGAVSAYFGGWLDQLVSRGVDVWYSFPALLLIVLTKEIIEQGDPKRGLWAIVFALSLYAWMHFARIIRGEVLRIRTLEYTQAAKSLGLGHFRIIFRHIIPNTWGPLLVTVTMRIPLAILAESMLGFIGLGVKSPMASWGTLASEGWQAMRFFPHLIFFPSLCLFVTILCFNLVGEYLRDYFDPR